MQASNLLDQYFSGIRYIKYLNDSPVGTSTYVARLAHQSPKTRFVIVVVPRDNNALLSVLSAPHLSNWASIQTIDMYDNRFVPTPLPQDWVIPHVDVLGVMLKIAARTESYNEYGMSTPSSRIRVRITMDSSDRNCYKYPDNLPLQQAINTFRCFIYRTNL